MRATRLRWIAFRRVTWWMILTALLLPHISARVVESRIFRTPGVHAVRAPMLKISVLVADTK